MTPYHADPWLTVWQGDCREVMAQMEAESVHCVITSPPYWGLRDYGTATWLGGDEGCDHKAPSRFDYPLNAGLGPTGVQTQASNAASDQRSQFRSTCGKCGAIREDKALGLEPTPEEYVTNMVAVFREVRRVLRKDGTCWVNLGDCYNSSPSNQLAERDWGDGVQRAHYETGRRKRDISGLKPKDLAGIPWRVAFALQADGWYLRSDIIWSKPNPMPESVTDRPTKAHEYVFLLSKSARYYYDADAVREPILAVSAERYKSGYNASWKRAQEASVTDDRTDGFRGEPERLGSGRNLRSVWSIATQPYPGAHFATFPEALVEPCVKAGTSERGVCPECGAPWRRVAEKGYAPSARWGVGAGKPDRTDGYSYGKTFASVKYDPDDQGSARSGSHVPGLVRADVTTGWQPSCSHDATPVPATVLDPFAGSGTTGRVAQRLGRRAVLIDLNGEYLTQAMTRNADIPLGLEAI